MARGKGRGSRPPRRASCGRARRIPSPFRARPGSRGGGGTGSGIALYRWMGGSGDDLRIGAIMLGCPTAVVTYVMAARLRGDTDLAGAIVIVSAAASAGPLAARLV